MGTMTQAAESREPKCSSRAPYLCGEAEGKACEYSFLARQMARRPHTHTHTHSDPHRLTEKPFSLTLSSPSPPASYFLLCFLPTVPSLLTGRAKPSPRQQHMSSLPDSVSSSQRPRAERDKVRRQALTHQDTETHRPQSHHSTKKSAGAHTSHTLTHAGRHIEDATPIPGHTLADIHTQTLTGIYTDSHIHSKQKDTHTRRSSDTHTQRHTDA